MAPTDRHAAIKRVRLCFNCLKGAHGVMSCPSQISCSHCGKRHHSSLHFSDSNQDSQLVSQPVAKSSTESSALHVGTSITNSSTVKTVLLSTVMLDVLDVNGYPQPVRALCDPGSMASFMTDACARKLKLRRSRSLIPIAGLGQMSTKSSLGVSRCFIRPCGSSQVPLGLDVIILDKVCSDMPSTTLAPSNLVHFKPFKLADPKWYQPGTVDVLLGADIYSSIVRPGLERNINSSLVGIHTIFGVMLVGPALHSNLPQPVHSFFTAIDTPCSDSTLKKFWEIEEIPDRKCFSSDDEQAELHFQKTHFRTIDGRFGVSLPFRSEEPFFKDTYSLARRRFLALEHRFASNPLLKNEYCAFMDDYLKLGHMSLLKDPAATSNIYVIPHHCVFKVENDRPKIRVVFDASAKDGNGISLNDSLLTGPKLQNDIATILLRFRIYAVVFTCDVRQMYRQILVSEEQRRFQLILWRSSPLEELQTYQLNTVTYGVSSAPFLAIRTLLQLAEEGRYEFPLAVEAMKHGLYVDDLVCGADSLETALELQRQIIGLFKSGCFELRKWSSNSPTLLENLPDTPRLNQGISFDTNSNTQKILGLQWQSSSDSFVFAVKPLKSPCTKRSMLAEIARIYDPLGFLCPVTFLAKRLIQVLWTLGLGWDESPPVEICEKWQQYKSQLECLSSVQIPRIIIDISIESHELHAFCDASEQGYACVIYSRRTHPDGSVSISLLCAKSKVAPLKRLSIPRLELCAAVLLAKLVDWVCTTFKETFCFDRVFAWSDSTIVLTWIKSSPHRWKTFVSNRVSLIQDKLSPDCWHHVRSMENPADCGSRGFLPEEIISSSLWWAGPSWLSLSTSSWPLNDSEIDSLSGIDLEEKKTVLIVQITQGIIDPLFKRFSSLRKIQGSIAYCFRFLHNCKNVDRITGSLSQLELHKSLLVIVKIVQNEVFSQEIASLTRNEKCPKSLQRLSPFIDPNGVLRVGGRISRADLPFETKHPALLPRRHILTELVIAQIHQKNLHPGINTTLHLLQQNFWVLGARRAVRSNLSKCYRCFRLKPISIIQPMGDLPEVRVSQAKPFSIVGVDYGGPIPITISRARGVKTLKAYICLFVCLSTKAVHIEVVSDLSTDAFLAALRRFCARRGRCSHIYSDCGSNFVGADRQLREYLQLAAEKEAITWHFNPPSAPHFGGIWESGIKSFKTHLYRVIGSQVLTLEELNTLTVQIEALLNSRPLCSLSTDPNDLSSLTPGHFLTLEPLTAPPDPDLSHLKLSRLSRWQLVQHMHQAFWYRWSNEYLHHLYQRGKWFKSNKLENVDIGTLVLIKNELVPPLSWKLGRITKLHPGKDGICRVATVLTSQGTFQRPCVKLCPLPSQ